jgi:PIN domain nuclease of toxin-antitoxin system
VVGLVTVLADTHALLWWVGQPSKLSRTARRFLDGADALLVSPITCWEVAMLAARERIRLDREPHVWFRDLFATTTAEPTALAPETAVSAGLLDTADLALDPADRILYATARDLGVPLVTKDRALHDLGGRRGDVRIAW